MNQQSFGDRGLGMERSGVRRGSTRGRRRFVWTAMSIVCLLLGADTIRADAIQSDEQVIFFRRFAWLDEQKKEWVVPVHGWIFEPEGDDLLRQSALRAMREHPVLQVPDLTDAQRDRLNEMLQGLIVDNERGKAISVRIAGQSVQLPESDHDGHMKQEIRISRNAAEKHQSEGVLMLEALLPEKDKRSFSLRVPLLDPEGISVISDIDDTIKVTEVMDKKKLLRNTFLDPFTVVENMPQLYQHWELRGAAFHYVSSCPYLLYPGLVSFMDQAGYPQGEMYLKRVRMKDSSVMSLFEDPMDTKPPVIRAILQRYPKRTFLLVGDSGEMDPEVYGAIARESPNQVAGIYIRNVTRQSADNPRYADAFRDVPREKWKVFLDPTSLMQLEGDSK